MGKRSGKLRRLTCGECSHEFSLRCGAKPNRKRKCPECGIKSVPSNVIRIVQIVNTRKILPLDPPQSPALSRDDYRHYIRSLAWMHQRRRILARDCRRCRVCSQRANHVHHIHYRSLGNEIPLDLVLLCEDCHEVEHKTFTLTEREPFWLDQNQRIPNELSEPSQFARETQPG